MRFVRKNFQIRRLVSVLRSTGMQKQISMLLLAIMFAAPCAESRGRRDAHEMQLQEIRRQLKAGKAQNVVYELESLTRRDPQDVEAWLLLSKCYLDLDFSGNKIDKAMEAARKAVEAAPANSTALKACAEIHARKGQFKEALALLDKALAQKKVDPFVYKSRALILSETKQDKEALADWQKFESLVPSATTSYNSMDGGAIIYARAGKTDEAIARYDRLSKMRPGAAWDVRKGEAYVLGGRFKEAIAYYSKLIARSPDDETSLLARARLYCRVGRDKEALGDMNAVIREMPTSSMYLERARIYEKLGDAKAAKRDRDKAQSL